MKGCGRTPVSSYRSAQVQKISPPLLRSGGFHPAHSFQPSVKTAQWTVSPSLFSAGNGELRASERVLSENVIYMALSLFQPRSSSTRDVVEGILL